MLSQASQPVRSLYVHVPFCAHKCEYCAFYSEAAAGALIERYVGALIRELELVAHDLQPRTIFFGGGTPSLLNLRQWEKILQAMMRLNLLSAAEWTVECNPATVSLDKARLLRSYGVNRISMGVQSLDEQLLDRLGRVHSREMVFKSFDLLRQAGFENLNVDLMFAIPNQTMEIWRRTLDEATALGSEHLSCYEVIYEEDTPLFAQLQAGQFSVDEELACAMYEELLSVAAAKGLHQYEIANFAKDDATHRSADALIRANPKTPDGLADEGIRAPCNGVPSGACQHNLNYWRGGGFYGLGPSAAEFVRSVRTKNWSNTQLYCEQLECGRRAIESRDDLPPLKRAGEIAAFGLRMTSGWSLEEFHHTTGFDLRREWAGEMQQLIAQGWGQMDAERFKLTREGLRFADTAAELFLR